MLLKQDLLKKPLVGIDIDGTLRLLYERFIEVLIAHHPEYKERENELKYPATWNVEYLFPSDFDIAKFWFIDKVKPIYLTARSIGNPATYINDMKKDFRIALISSQPNDFCITYTLRWIGNCGIAPDSIIFTEEKHETGVDFLIDDKGETIEKAYMTGITTFLIDRCYNQGFQSSYRVGNYVEALYIIKNNFNNGG